VLPSVKFFCCFHTPQTKRSFFFFSVSSDGRLHFRRFFLIRRYLLVSSPKCPDSPPAIRKASPTSLLPALTLFVRQPKSRSVSTGRNYPGGLLDPTLPEIFPLLAPRISTFPNPPPAISRFTCSYVSVFCPNFVSNMQFVTPCSQSFPIKSFPSPAVFSSSTGFVASGCPVFLPFGFVCLLTLVNVLCGGLGRRLRGCFLLPHAQNAPFFDPFSPPIMVRTKHCLLKSNFLCMPFYHPTPNPPSRLWLGVDA